MVRSPGHSYGISRLRQQLEPTQVKNPTDLLEAQVIWPTPLLDFLTKLTQNKKKTL
jgi:hypothetical protein